MVTTNRNFAAALTLFTLLLTSACSRNAEPAASASSSSAVPAEAPAAAPEKIASGPIVVEQQVDLLAGVESVVVALNADLGAYVKQGELLAQLDDRQLSQQREALSAKIRSIEADLKNWQALAESSDAETRRAEEMWKSKLIPQQEFERVQYRSQAAHFEVERERENLNDHQAQLRALEVQLSKTRVVAPFNGVVARRYVTVGQKVLQNDRLFWISATAPMRVRFMLPEKYLSQVRSGTQLQVQAEVAAGAPELKCDAKVIRMSPIVDPASGTVETLAELSGAPAEMRPGMSADLYLVKQ